MATDVTASFEITGWDEDPFDMEPEAGKLTRAEVTRTFSGDIEGEATVVYLMAYAPDGTATFTGLERVRGTIAGRQGSIVLEHSGSFRDGAARASVRVVPGSGVGELGSASGSGDFVADPAGSVRLQLTFDRDDA